MARLFISQREVNFISDITKEVIKDVVGQKIYYYPVSESKTKSHGVYGEATQKVFDNPIIVDAIVDNISQGETIINEFGPDAQFKIEVFTQYRDLVEKGVNLEIGDYFSFSDVFYEVSEKVIMRNIYGLAEHYDGVKLVGTRVRDSQFKAKFIGPTDVSYSDKDAIQNDFYQQRGFPENAEGETLDKRALVESGVLEQPISPPREVSNREKLSSGSSFYGED